MCPIRRILSGRGKHDQVAPTHLAAVQPLPLTHPQAAVSILPYRARPAYVPVPPLPVKMHKVIAAPVRRSKFKKYCTRRAKGRGTNVVCGNPFDIDNVPSQCMRCDHGRRRRCSRLPHCHAKVRSPNGVNRRELLRAANRARRAKTKAAGAQRAHPLPSLQHLLRRACLIEPCVPPAPCQLCRPCTTAAIR